MLLSQTQVSELQNSLSLSQACVVELKPQLALHSGKCQAKCTEVELARVALDVTREELAEVQIIKGTLQMQNIQLQVSTNHTVMWMKYDSFGIGNLFMYITDICPFYD